MARSIAMCLAVLLAPSVLPAQADKPQLVVAIEPQGTAKELNYRTTSAEATAVLYVRNTGPHELKGLRLAAQFHDTGNAEATVDLKSKDDRHLDDGSLILPAGGEIAVELKAVRLPVGKQTGYLVASHGSTSVIVSPFSVEHRAEPALAFVGVAGGAALEGTVFENQFQRRYSLRSQNETPIEALHVSTSQLTGPDGKQRPVMIDLGTKGQLPVRLNGREVIDVTLTTETPVVGTYKGTLLLSYDQQAKEVPLTITRDKKPLPYEILPIDEVRENWFLGVWPSRVRVAIHELNGVKQTSPLPELPSLVTAVTGQTPHQTTFHSLQWVDDAEQPVKSIDLEPGQTRGLWLKISGLSGAGTHSGNLRLSLTDGQVVSQKVSILTRHHWFWAIAIIALGVGLSLLLKFLSSRSANMREQVQLARLAANAAWWLANPTLNGRGRPILEGLRFRIIETLDACRLRQGKTYRAEIAELEVKIGLVPKWASLVEEAAALDPPDPDLRQELDQIHRYLVMKDTTPEKLTLTARQLDETIPAKIKTQARNSLLTAINELSGQIEAYQSDPMASAQRLIALADIKTGLTGTAAKAGGDQVAAARDEFNQARRAFVQALIDELDGRLRDVPPALQSFPEGEGEWTLQSRELTRTLATAEALSDPNSTLQAYFRVRIGSSAQVARLLVRLLARKIITLPDNADPRAKEALETQHANWKALLERLRTLRVDSEFKPEDLFGIERDIVAATMDAEPYDAGQEALRDEGATAVAGAAPPGVHLPAAGSTVVTEPDRVAFPNVNELQTKLDRNEWLLAALTAAVAALLGLKLLWLDNLVWGTISDYLLALLWGLGLHQVANASFDFNKLTRELTSPATEAGATG